VPAPEPVADLGGMTAFCTSDGAVDAQDRVCVGVTPGIATVTQT